MSMSHEDAEREGRGQNPLSNTVPQTTEILRCIRCHGRRSRAYHWEHWQDPVLHPAAGICSRKRTKCAEVQARSDHHLGVHELPATWSRTWKLDTYAT